MKPQVTIVATSASGIASYPPFLAASQHPTPLLPTHPFLPFLPHPDRDAPALPPRPDLPPPPKGFTRTLHASPAAYPRSLRDATGHWSRASHPYRTTTVSANESKEDRKRRQAGETLENIRQRYASEVFTTLDEATAAGSQALWQGVERWKRDVPVGGQRGLTLILSHANGMQREHWQPFLYNLLTRDPREKASVFGTGEPLSENTHIVIDDVWMLDDVNHGSSVDLNHGRLGGSQAWTDTGRDVLNFVQHVLPSIKMAEDQNWQVGQDRQLKWTPTEYSELVSPHRVIGIGHSFGGNAMVQASHARPDLFQAVFLVDPMCTATNIPPEVGLGQRSQYQLSDGAVKRRMEWPSRDAAREILKQSPFYGAWHDDVFELLISHGLVPIDYASPDGAVTLATPGWCEAAVFTEPYGMGNGWDKLSSLPIPVGFIMAGDSTAARLDNMAQEMVWRAKLSRNERAVDNGHLILQESPALTAESFWRFLTTLQAGRWGSNQKEIMDEFALATSTCKARL